MTGGNEPLPLSMRTVDGTWVCILTWRVGALAREGCKRTRAYPPHFGLGKETSYMNRLIVRTCPKLADESSIKIRCVSGF